VDVGVGCGLLFATGKEQPGGALDWPTLALSWKQDYLSFVRLVATHLALIGR